MSEGQSTGSPNAPAAAPFGYQDELALVSYLVNSLERRLAGRHETRILRTIPSDHCHLGVLGPRDPHVTEPEPLEIEEGAAASAPAAAKKSGQGANVIAAAADSEQEEEGGTG